MDSKVSRVRYRWRSKVLSFLCDLVGTVVGVNPYRVALVICKVDKIAV